MVDWLDVGFNILIGVVALFILCWWGFKIKNMIDKQKKEKPKKKVIDKELEDDLDEFLGV